MKIDMTQCILGRDGKPVPVTMHLPDGRIVADPGGAVLTLSHVCVTAAEAMLKIDEGKGWREKHKLGALADAVAGESAELSAEDIATLKERVGLTYSAYVVRRAIDMLDPPAASPNA